MNPSTTNIIRFEDRSKKEPKVEITTSASNEITETIEEKGSETMSNQKYATKAELEHLENIIELKMENITEKIGAKVDLVNHKIDTIPDTIKIMLLEEREEQRKQKSETMKFLVGTIILGGLGLVVSIISLFF